MSKKEQIASSAAEEALTLSLLDRSNTCTLYHRGIVLDLGSTLGDSARSFALATSGEAKLSEHLGESFRLLDQAQTELVFWADHSIRKFAVQLSVHGRASTRLSVALDGRRLGTAKIRPDQTQVLTLPAPGAPLAPGRHTLRLGLSRKKGSPPEAEVSWIRIGPRGLRDEDLPSTRRSTFSEVTIEGVRHQGIVLPPAATVRCPLLMTPGMVLKASIGVWGQGAIDGELSLISEEGQRSVLHSDRRDEDAPRTFLPLEVALPSKQAQGGAQLVELELSAKNLGSAAKWVFGQPMLETAAGTAFQPRLARRAIVVLLSGLSDGHFPPESAKTGLPLFNRLSDEALYFPQYQSVSSSVTSTVASLLTGVGAASHGVTNAPFALSPQIPTLAATVEAAGGRSAWFSGVPLSSGEFGLNRGFESISQIHPQQDEAAVKPLEQAQDWLQSTLGHKAPVLAVVHLRGGHPPFDVTKKESELLPPSEYGGSLSARRAAIQLATIRRRRSLRHRTLPDEDWQRFFALQKAALLKQNHALVEFFDWLKRQSAYDDSLIVVAGDVGAGSPPAVPFDHDAALSPVHLRVPLLVKLPGKSAQGTVQGRFAPMDLTQTIADALAVEWQNSPGAISLFSPGRVSLARARAHVAYRDHEYSVRLGKYLLMGTDGEPPRLCLPELDPPCSVDRSDDLPRITRSLWLSTWDSLAGVRDAPAPPPFEPSLELENALIIWGVGR